MKQYRFLLGLIAIIAFFSACKKDRVHCDTMPADPFAEKSYLASVRIKNNTGKDLCQLIIDPAGTLSDKPGPYSKQYGNLEDGEFSQYHSFEFIYRYAWINAISLIDTLFAKPFDYIGEIPLDSGKYTYEISKYTGTCTDCLSLNLLKDQ